MAIPKAVDTQRDFTAGEIDATAKRRDDDDFIRKGMRQLSNWRVINTGGVTSRPGRNLLQLFGAQARVEEILIAPGVKYRFAFTPGELQIFDATGTQVFADGAPPWTANQLGQIIFAVYLKQVFITFPGMQPWVLTWDGVSAWSRSNLTELVVGNQKRTPFYRIAPQGITLAPGGAIGSITLATSAVYFLNSMVGTRIRYVGRQILITSVTNPGLAQGTVEEALPGSQNVDFGSINPATIFAVGDLVRGTNSGAEGVVVQFGGGISGNGMGVQLLTLGTSTEQVAGSPQTEAFISSDIIISAGGSAPIVGTAAIGPPQPCAVWDEEVMNAFRGWPRSVAADQGRLIFCDFPSVTNGIAWSAIGSPLDLNVGSLPSDGMFELVPGKNRVQHVVAGPESAEFVFCDAAVFYIPISQSNPLKPGSVAFQKISSDGAGTMQPRTVGETIIFADSGLIQLQAIVVLGAYNRPFITQPITDFHSHLFNNIQAIALPTSVTQFPERYAYVLNGDGTMAIGKYVLDDSGKLSGKIGWLPWNGVGAVKWASALNDVVLFVTSYTAGATTAYMVEQLDATLYLDASLPINAIPATLTPPGGKGPLWWLPTATVDLMDGRLPLGPHTTDANGFIVPITPGEDLTSVTLRAGFDWIGIAEPFVTTPQTAQDGEERMKKRRISRFETYVVGSSGFRFAKFYSGVIGPNLPALGSIVSDRRIAAYNQGDDATQPPPLREQSYAYKPLGRSHDPRVGIIKDTPGPLTVVEIAARASL